MEEKELENWRKAGKIGAEVLEYAKGIVKPKTKSIPEIIATR